MYAHDNFAVMLNANARKVSKGVKAKIERIVAPENIFYSHSLDESQGIAQEIAERDYSVVFTGGGDGTFTHFINDYFRAASSVPNIGVLHLGTGNAVASIVSSGNYECDLRSYIDSGYKDFQPLDLVQCEGMRFPFGGLGWDGEILNDYIFLKNRYGSNRLLKPVVQNLGGYFAALFTRTIPRHVAKLWRKPATVRITNLGAEAYALHGGEMVKSFSRGDVLYEGPSNITLFGTCPYYGHGFTVLPYSMSRPGFFQLRVCTMSLLKAIVKLRRLWSGKYVGPDMIDWHVKHVKLEFSEPVPYQYGGDAQGYRSELEVKTSPVKVNLLRFI